MNSSEKKILEYFKKKLGLDSIGAKPKNIPLWQIARDNDTKLRAVKYTLDKLVKKNMIERFTFYFPNKKGLLRKHTAFRLTPRILDAP